MDSNEGFFGTFSPDLQLFDSPNQTSMQDAMQQAARRSVSRDRSVQPDGSVLTYRLSIPPAETQNMESSVLQTVREGSNVPLRSPSPDSTIRFDQDLATAFHTSPPAVRRSPRIVSPAGRGVTPQQPSVAELVSLPALGASPRIGSPGDQPGRNTMETSVTALASMPSARLSPRIGSPANHGGGVMMQQSVTGPASMSSSRRSSRHASPAGANGNTMKSLVETPRTPPSPPWLSQTYEEPDAETEEGRLLASERTDDAYRFMRRIFGSYTHVCNANQNLELLLAPKTAKRLQEGAKPKKKK